MPNSNWGPLIAVIVGCVLAALVSPLVYQMAVSHAERQARAEHNTEREYQSADERIAATCLVLTTAVAVSECTAKEVKAAEDARRSEYDLSAQQDMGDWAFWMVWVSVASVAITTVGVGFVWFNLREARVLTKEAILANNMAKLGARPWVSIKEPKVTKILFIQSDSEQGHLYLDFSVRFANSGDTPALHCIRTKDLVNVERHGLQASLEQIVIDVSKGTLQGFSIAPDADEIVRFVAVLDLWVPGPRHKTTLILGVHVAIGYAGVAIDGRAVSNAVYLLSEGPEENNRPLDLRRIIKGEVDVRFVRTDGHMT